MSKSKLRDIMGIFESLMEKDKIRLSFNLETKDAVAGGKWERIINGVLVREHPTYL